MQISHTAKLPHEQQSLYQCYRGALVEKNNKARRYGSKAGRPKTNYLS